MQMQQSQRLEQRVYGRTTLQSDAVVTAARRLSPPDDGTLAVVTQATQYTQAVVTAL